MEDLNIMGGDLRWRYFMKDFRNVVVNPELGFYPALIDAENNRVLIGRWIGAVEVIVDGYQDEDGWEYVTELYLAYQLATGKIVYVEEYDPELPMHVHSLKGVIKEIKPGYYPLEFKKEWRYYVIQPVVSSETVEEPFLPC